MDLDAALTRSIELAGAARAAGDHPFGALLVVDGEVVAEAANRVHTDRDLTAHAELMLARILEREGRLDQLAAGTVVASTEPCPMCVGAMFWAGQRVRLGQSVWPAAAFFGLLVSVQIIAMLMPKEAADTLMGFGPSALAVYLLLAGVAVFLDGRRAS